MNSLDKLMQKYERQRRPLESSVVDSAGDTEIEESIGQGDTIEIYFLEQEKSKRLPSTWRESAAVVRLSHFLKECGKEFGIRLQREWKRESGEHVFYLNFQPGISKWETERWDAAAYAESLLVEACDDLVHLIRIGALNLPPHTRIC